MDYIHFCKSYFASTHLPILLFENDRLLFQIGLDDDYLPLSVFRQAMEKRDSMPQIITLNSGYYGIIEISSGSKLYLMLGPAFSNPLSEEVLLEYSKENSIPRTKKKALKERLSILPSYTYYRFTSTIGFLEYVLNGRTLELATDFHLADENYKDGIASAQAEQAYESRDEQLIHGTYRFEQQILNLVKEGNPIALEKLLLESATSGIFNEGAVANTPLRQAKNIFLSLVSIIGKMAAIPGGLDIEQTYQLIDAYSQECEQMTNASDVTNLQFNMLLDFANRVSQSKMPDGISSESYTCIQYINSHLNEPINIDDIAKHIHRSRSYTMKHFNENLGFNLGEYISHARIQEAKSLLRYTDKSLSEISNYLCYSSQSYFQNVFKKLTGQTPAEYRKNSHEY